MINGFVTCFYTFMCFCDAVEARFSTISAGRAACARTVLASDYTFLALFDTGGAGFSTFFIATFLQMLFACFDTGLASFNCFFARSNTMLMHGTDCFIFVSALFACFNYFFAQLSAVTTCFGMISHRFLPFIGKLNNLLILYYGYFV